MIDKFFEDYNKIREEYDCYYELDDQRNVWWMEDGDSVYWWSEKPSDEDIEEGYIDSEYAEEIYGTSVTRKEKYTGITYYDGCGNKTSGLFDNDKEIKPL